MSHITEFKVTGLVGRSEVYSQKLNRDVNVFFGINGSGKTSLLKILRSAMAKDASLLEGVVFDTAEVKIYSNDYQREFTYSIKTLAKGKNRDHLELDQSLNDEFASMQHVKNTAPKLSWTVKPSIKLSAGQWRHAYLPTSRLYVAGIRSNDRQFMVEQSEEQLEEQFVQSLQSVWSFYFADVMRTVRIAQEQGLKSILEQVLSPDESDDSDSINSDEDAAYKSAISFLSRSSPDDSKKQISKKAFKTRYQSDQLLRHVVRDIENVEKTIELATVPTSKLQELMCKLFSNKTVDFLDRKIRVLAPDGRDIELSKLSAGEKHLLTIMVTVLRVKDSTVLIDEPELSMHIDWQKCLISSLQQVNPNAQIIMATHSPEIMAEIDDDRIFSV